MSEPVDDCVFCKIIAGEIPADVLARNEHAVSFKDLHPQAPFHALVVPLAHHTDAAADPSIVGHAVALADEVARAAGNDHYRLVANTGRGAGQTVYHTHFHVLAGSSGMTERLV